jgi:hypothetical protein
MSLDVFLIEVKPTRIYTSNITHNLGEMAEQCGLYEALWRPEELSAKYARDLIDPIQKGLELLRSDPERFKTFNPENGWGDYDGLVKFAENYLRACTENPNAEVETWR